MKLFASALVTALVTALFFCGLLITSTVHAEQIQRDRISVVGAGIVEQEPDMATLSISISSQKSTLAQAKQSADEKYRSVLKVIKKAGISDKNIKSTQMLAQPQYDWGNKTRQYKGELVSRSLSIKILDLDKLSPLMHELVTHGVSTINGVHTDFSNRAELTRKALGAAADDARSKADFLAKRLGRTLGAAYEISEHSTSAPRHYESMSLQASPMRKSAAAAPPEMFGTQKINATVNVSFNLL